MITYVSGDIFDSPAQVLVNPVNTVGVMGKGLAYHFKKNYPAMFKQYQQLCERHQFIVGQLWLYKTPHKWILNFPTKVHWRENSKPEYIEVGLKKFAETYADKGILSISFPLLGCGYGELDWKSQVRPLMERYLGSLPISIYIHRYAKNDLMPKHYKPNVAHRHPDTLTFDEFWNDLISIANSNTIFETLDTKTRFEVQLDEKKDGIHFIVQGRKSVFVAKEDNGWSDFWRHIQQTKYCLAENFPMGLEGYATYVISFLSELGYIRPVRLSQHDYDEQNQIGLQIVSGLADREKPISEGNFVSNFDPHDNIPF